MWWLVFPFMQHKKKSNKICLFNFARKHEILFAKSLFSEIFAKMLSPNNSRILRGFLPSRVLHIIAIPHSSYTLYPLRSTLTTTYCIVYNVYVHCTRYLHSSLEWANFLLFESLIKVLRIITKPASQHWLTKSIEKNQIWCQFVSGFWFVEISPHPVVSVRKSAHLNKKRPVFNLINRYI